MVVSNILYVHLHLGKISILILTSIFFNWGFNHHLGQRVFKPFFPTWPPTFSGHQKKNLRHPSKTAHSDFRVGPKVGIQREIHPKAPLNSGDGVSCPPVYAELLWNAACKSRMQRCRTFSEWFESCISYIHILRVQRCTYMHVSKNIYCFQPFV